MRNFLPLFFAACILLAGCTKDAARSFGEWMIADRGELTFEIDAVRPVFACKNVPDPRYPCAGIGPEGFARDLVVKPFANKHVVDMYSDIRKAGTRVRLVWFSMQGGCGLGRAHDRVIPQEIGVLPYIIEGMDGELKRYNLAREMRVQKSQAPLGNCTTGIDMSAGQPFRMKLVLWAPGKFGEDLRVPVIPSATPGKFQTGCRTEKRNGINWQVCNTAGKWRRSYKGVATYHEQREEVWTARLGKAGYVLRITASFRDPIFQYPQWYAERQANLLEVIDTITVEPLPYPPVIPEPPPQPETAGKQPQP